MIQRQDFANIPTKLISEVEPGTMRGGERFLRPYLGRKAERQSSQKKQISTLSLLADFPSEAERWDQIVFLSTRADVWNRGNFPYGHRKNLR